MREPQSKVIDGVTYEVQMLPGTKSWKMLLRLGKMIGPALGKVIDGSEGSLQNLMNADLSEVFIGEALTALTERMDEAEVEIIIQQLAECTIVDNKPLKGIFELHFQGNPGALLKWLAFAVQANFAPFSNALASVQQGQQEGETKQQA